MDNSRMIALSREPIDLAALQASTPADGALCLFVGIVRGENGGRAVLRLEYEAYEEMATAGMEQIAADARARWPVTDIGIQHRLGPIEVGQASVVVAVTSPHRGEAFEACRYVIDTLKKTVPIWKKEFYADGAVWLEGPASAPPIADPRGV